MTSISIGITLPRLLTFFVVLVLFGLTKLMVGK
jgi:hypothetical protein